MKVFMNNNASVYQELPGESTFAAVDYFMQFRQLEYQSIPKSFVIMTGPGVYYGNFAFGSQKFGDSVIEGASLMPYPVG